MTAKPVKYQPINAAGNIRCPHCSRLEGVSVYLPRHQFSADRLDTFLSRLERGDNLSGLLCDDCNEYQNARERERRQVIRSEYRFNAEYLAFIFGPRSQPKTTYPNGTTIRFVAVNPPSIYSRSNRLTLR